MRKLEKRKKERKEKKIHYPWYNLLTAFQSNMFNPGRKRRIGVEDLVPDIPNLNNRTSILCSTE
jgi:hypothetical protein